VTALAASDVPTIRCFVIVGASFAGATAAATLREEGFTGRIVLIGDEPSRPYERPPLSKEYLLGTCEREKVYVHAQNWYDENNVELLLGVTVTRIDREAQQVIVADGEPIAYDALLLTTGSTPRLLTLPGAELDGVHYLRRIEDSDRIKEAFAGKPRVVVIGGGWIGLETAAAARASGLEVTVLEVGELPLLRVLGRDVAQVFADLHRDNKVDLRCNVQVAELIGADGKVTGVRLADGTRLDTDLVLVGVGITPNDSLAADAGLEVDNGIVVDQQLCTSDAAIFAAGDVANAYHPVLHRNLRVEHWANAQRQGVLAARSMLDLPSTYDWLPYFFSDQYELGMEYTGYVEPEGFDQVVFRGDVAGREFIAFWMSDGRVLAGMNVNVWDVTAPIEKLIDSRRRFDLSALADPNVPLESL
jgi:3-phenylpropionate/trans-cinnamate dioxygenase ferredoxin reductase subunit